MIRRAIDWLRAEIATPTVGQLADRLELAENAAARNAAQIAALEDRLRESEAARFDLVEQLAEACRERDEAIERADHADARWSTNIRALEYLHKAKDRLARIATLGAASRNGTARKLARIAREALE